MMKEPDRFMIVDDDPTNNLLCTYALRRILPAIDVMQFERPEVALGTIEEEYSKPDQHIPTILLLDVNMPVLNGWDFLNVFKDFSNHVHQQFVIYILSSSVDQRDIDKANLNPFVAGYVPKPLNEASIKQMIGV